MQKVDVKGLFLILSNQYLVEIPKCIELLLL